MMLIHILSAYLFHPPVVWCEFYTHSYPFTQHYQFSNVACFQIGLLYVSPLLPFRTLSLVSNSSCFSFQNLSSSPVSLKYTPECCHWEAAWMQTCCYLLKTFLMAAYSQHMARTPSDEGQPFGAITSFLPPSSSMLRELMSPQLPGNASLSLLTLHSQPGLPSSLLWVSTETQSWVISSWSYFPLRLS